MAKKNAVLILFFTYFSLCLAAAQETGINFIVPPFLAPFLESAPQITSEAAVLIDAETGVVLFSKNPHGEIPPASLTKLMTMHLVMSAAQAGKLSLDDVIPITQESWARRQPPRSSLMFLAPGQIVTMRGILLGLAVSSGNDAAVAAALRLAPSVAGFAEMMTAEARRLGMSKTRFTEPSGISEYNITTAAEFAAFCKLYIALHPQSLNEYHSVPVFAFPLPENLPPALRDNPGTIVQYNRNALLRTIEGCDGLKTGYIDEAGYSIAVTAMREGTRFLAVILGAPASPGGDRIRDRDGAALINWAFENFKTVRPEIPPIAPVRIWKGKENSVEVEAAGKAVYTSPASFGGNLTVIVETDARLCAPLPLGYTVGHISFFDMHTEVLRIPLVTGRQCEQGSFLKRIWHSILLWFRRP